MPAQRRLYLLPRIQEALERLDWCWGPPQQLNLEAITECALLQTYMKVRAFLGLLGYYRRFIKGFGHFSQPLSE